MDRARGAATNTRWRRRKPREMARPGGSKQQ